MLSLDRIFQNYRGFPVNNYELEMLHTEFLLVFSMLSPIGFAITIFAGIIAYLAYLNS